jgi:hypothetical protein
VARRLGRTLTGEPSPPSDEYFLLHLLNSAQRDQLEDLLARSDANPRIGNDLVSLVRNRLRRESQEEARPPVEHSIAVPALVWERYAQRAREGHRRVDSVLVDALLRDDERLCQGQQEASDARNAFCDQVAELGGQLMAVKAALEGWQGGAGHLESERNAALGEIGRNVAAQAFAIAAVLKVLYDKGWVTRPLLTALKARGWLTE